MAISDYVSMHEVDGRTCADIYNRSTSKPDAVRIIMEELGFKPDIAWLVVEALDAMEDLRG